MVGLSEKDQKPVWAVEIKWSNQYYQQPRRLKSLIKFCKKNNLPDALITSIDKSGTEMIDDIRFHFLPSAAYAYTVGRNTFDLKSEIG